MASPSALPSIRDNNFRTTGLETRIPVYQKHQTNSSGTHSPWSTESKVQRSKDHVEKKDSSKVLKSPYNLQVEVSTQDDQQRFAFLTDCRPTPANLRKSPSCPNQFMDGQISHYSDCNDSPPADTKSGQTTAFSATVLLAIPEGGESDYFAESPQCLTADELRQLGLYDDDDDDSDDEEEETVLEMVELDNRCTPTGCQQEESDHLIDCCSDLSNSQLLSAFKVNVEMSENSSEALSTVDTAKRTHCFVPTVNEELVR